VVILYSTGCPKCKILKEKLDSKSITYQVYDNAELMIQKGFRSVPMLEVDGVLMDFLQANNWIKEI
jgi:glutaredoxin